MQGGLQTLPLKPENAEEMAGLRIQTLVGQYTGVLYRTAYRLTGSREDAQDLVQETFARAWRARATFRPEGNGRAWLFAIMMNARAEAFRRVRRAPPVVSVETIDDLDVSGRIGPGSLPFHAQDPEETVFGALLSEEVQAVLHRIPGQFLATFILADLERFPYQEISQILGLPLGTVRSRVFRARRRLERALWDYCLRTGQCRVPAAGAAAAAWLPGCIEACRHIYRFLDCEFDAPALARVKAHLAICRRCCDRVAFQQRLWQTIRAQQPDLQVRDSLRRRLTQVVSAFQRGASGLREERRPVRIYSEEVYGSHQGPHSA